VSLQCFQPERPPRPADGQPDVDDGPGEGEERAVRCGSCGAEITSERAVTEVQGKADHTFFNPAGVIFEIRCYSAAPGCEVLGQPTTEFSWFPGYAWSYALCGACGDHLGWQFEGGGPAFLGLIRSKLA